MLGFGIAQEKVLPLMSQLGDISGGNADRFQSLALAFSQVSSAGKLQGQDLNQMINAGFNPLESIAKRTGKSVGYWKEQMSKGKVTTQMVEQAMKDATSQGGRFFGMMDKQSKTALGQWSTFQDNLNMLLAEFGKIILPTAISVLQKLSSALERFNSLSEGAKKTILVIGGIAAAIGPVITIVGALIKSVAGLNVALAFLAANPIVAVLTGIAAATWLVIKGIEALIKKLTALKAVKISGKSFNLKSESNLEFLSDEKKKLGAKEFNKKYDRSIQKAVKNYDKSQTNSNNTTNNTNNNTTNNYYTPISATNRVAQYAY
jgi:tape measure domain-containing protein